MNKSIKESRKMWIKNLRTQITNLRLLDKSDKEIKKQTKKEFTQHCTFTELCMQKIFIMLLIGFVFFGMHISYAILMWEMHIYEFSINFSPYTSMILFALIGILLLGIFTFWFSFFVDWLRYYKIINDGLEEHFYLKLCKALLILAFIGFIIFMIMVFAVGWQISNLHQIPLGKSLFNTFIEIID
ncbi:hypothetical protein [Helicobacter mesocricetorum]|uniref:hypothetical protein n=1 Tax=Helicobacter mesocricetorum TaxID=87012 RepID=UPI001F2BE316|nr:hypothetical protein [Helicobacter mesocricetorum]